MKSIFRTRWRIVRDGYCGYEVQFREWWMPFWLEHGFTNTHVSIARAKDYIERHKTHVVEVVS